MDSLSSIYRSRADRLLVEFWAAHIAMAAIVGVLLVLLTRLSLWVLPVAVAIACVLAALELAVGERLLRRALLRPRGGLRPREGMNTSARRRVETASANNLPRLANLVEGVCLIVGVSPPALAVAPGKAANAAVFGRRPDRSTIVVTQGLLDTLNRIELEAVVARLLAQIRDGRTASLTTAVTTVGLPALLWPSLWPLLRARTEREAATGDDFEDDAEAVRLTRYPPGLAAALMAVSLAGVGVRASAVTWPLWLADPRAAASDLNDATKVADKAAGDMSTKEKAHTLPDYRSDLATRVAVLQEL